MKKLLVFIITSIAIIAIFLTLLPPSNTLTTLLTLNSCSDVKAIRQPSLYQDGEHSLKNGNIDEALKTITKGKASAKDSNEYYRYEILQAKYFFYTMQVDSFLKSNHKLCQYIRRCEEAISNGTDKKQKDDSNSIATRELKLLKLDCEMQKGVYEAKMTGRMDSALTHDITTLELSEEFPELPDYRLLALTNLADVYKQLGQYDKSVNYYKEALLLGDSLGMSSATRINVAIGIASAYASMGSFCQSADWWKKAEELKDDMQPVELFHYLNNRGNDYYLQSKYEESLQCFLELDSMLSTEKNMVWEMMFERTNLSDVYIRLGQIEKALPLLKQTEEFFTNQQQHLPLFYLTTQRIELAIISGNLAEAKRLVKEDPIPEWMIPEQKQLRRLVLLRLYKEAGMWKEYADVVNDYTELYDSISNGNMKMRFSEKIMSYEHEKQMLNKQRELEAKDLSFRWALALLVATVTILVMLVIIFYMQNRERKFREREVRNSIARLRMETIRNRITPHFISNALTVEINAQMEGKETSLDSLVQLLHRGIELTDVEESTLNDELAFIRFYCEVEKRSVGSDFRLDIDLGKDIDTDKVMLPSMAIQIMVENAIKHGLKAKKPQEGKLRRVMVKGTKVCDAVLIEVIDNGVGLPSGSKPKEHTGLKVVRQTIMLLNEQHLQAAGAKAQPLMDYGIGNYTHTDGDTGCRAWLLLPDNFKYTFNNYSLPQ